MISISGIRVPRPRIERTIRKIPGQLSVGDTSVATTTTALIDLVESLQERDLKGVNGYALRHSIPFQLGVTAADAILAPTRVDPKLLWAAYRIDVNWFNCPTRNGFLQTHARLEVATPNIARFSVTANSGETVCAQGNIHYVSIHDGINNATNRSVSRPNIAKKRQEDNSIEEHYSNSLLQLLMNPIAGSREPLGRRLHPLGCLPLGAAVHQATRLKPDGVPASASMKYHSTLSPDNGFSTRAVLDGDTVRVSLTDELGVEAAVAVILLRPLPRPSSTSLSDRK